LNNNFSLLQLTASRLVVSVRFLDVASTSGNAYCLTTSLRQIVSANSVYQSTFYSPYAINIKTVEVLLSGLAPLQSYSIYCGLKNSFGSFSSSSEIQSTQFNVTTPCCKTIFISASPSFIFNQDIVYTSGSQPFVVTSMSISNLPNVSITITPVLINATNNMSLSTTDYSISPTTFTWTSNSRIYSNSFVILINNDELSGSIRVYGVLSGQSKNEYYSVIADAKAFPIIPYVAATIPAPTLMSSIFGDSGLNIYILFDSNTNLATSYSLSTTWPCSKVLNFTDSLTSSCSWINSSSILINLPSSPQTNIGSSITLRGGILHAACSGSINCQLLPNNSIQTISVSAPYNPSKPVPIVSGSSKVNPCASFTVDPSLSY
jgi:hypothetical protein